MREKKNIVMIFIMSPTHRNKLFNKHYKDWNNPMLPQGKTVYSKCCKNITILFNRIWVRQVLWRVIIPSVADRETTWVVPNRWRRTSVPGFQSGMWHNRSCLLDSYSFNKSQGVQLCWEPFFLHIICPDKCSAC